MKSLGGTAVQGCATTREPLATFCKAFGAEQHDLSPIPSSATASTEKPVDNLRPTPYLVYGRVRSTPRSSTRDDESNPMNEIYLTPRELDVMSILWRSGSGTVGEVREALGEELAYTSVLSILQTLEEKGHVRHESEGRAYRYYPAVEKEAAGQSAISRIRQAVFHGSAEMLFAQLVADRNLKREELERMRRMLNERLKEDS
jgi:BlaI family transcriptional regulator, penicillinase repressor